MDALIERIVKWAKEQPEILALYLYGSVAEGRTHALSDLDLGLLLRPELTKQEIWRLEDRWSALWPETVDLRVLNQAPIAFQFDVITRGQRIWFADSGPVAEQESLIYRKYWDEEPRLKEEADAYMRRIAEARSITEQQEYQSTLEKIRGVHRRVRKEATDAL